MHELRVALFESELGQSEKLTTVQSQILSWATFCHTPPNYVCGTCNVYTTNWRSVNISSREGFFLYADFAKYSAFVNNSTACFGNPLYGFW